MQNVSFFARKNLLADNAPLNTLNTVSTALSKSFAESPKYIRCLKKFTKLHIFQKKMFFTQKFLLGFQSVVLRTCREALMKRGESIGSMLENGKWNKIFEKNIFSDSFLPDTLNSVLTVLPNFSQWIFCSFSHGTKSYKVYPFTSFTFSQNILLEEYIQVSTTLLHFPDKIPKNFAESLKRGKKWNNSQKSFFPDNLSLDTLNAVLKTPRKFSSRSPKNLNQSPKNSSKSFFHKRFPSKCLCGHVKCTFGSPTSVILSKVQSCFGQSTKKIVKLCLFRKFNFPKSVLPATLNAILKNLTENFAGNPKASRKPKKVRKLPNFRSFFDGNVCLDFQNVVSTIHPQYFSEETGNNSLNVENW